MDEFDVAIVGAGAAGAILAARLSENNIRRVILVEAGSDTASAARRIAPERASAQRPT